MALEMIQGVWPLVCEVPPGKATELRDTIARALNGTGYEVYSVAPDGSEFVIENRAAGVGHRCRVRVHDGRLMLGGLANAPMPLVEDLRRALAEHAGRMGYCLIS